MASISPSFFILGLVVALSTANEPSTNSLASAPVTATAPSANRIPDTTLKGNNTVNTVTPSNDTSNMATKIPINVTTSYSTVNPTVTKKDGGYTKDGRGATTARPTPKPGDATKVPTTKDKGKDMVTKTPAAVSDGDNTGIIIIVVIIIIALVFAVACFFARKRGQRYSVDFTSRPDEANIPLSVVEPELNIDAVPQNGLQTFESVETTQKESEEPETRPEAQEEQKGDADTSVAEPSAESQSSSGDKPKEDVVEPSPPAPVELGLDDKTDDEGAVSTKTSVESLKETNENNSNNADLSQTTDLMNFQDVPLDCPV